MKQTKLFAYVTFLLGSVALAGHDANRQILADFESCKSDDVVAPGPGATSKPWRRFGEATSDNIIATTTGPLSGKVSATYPLHWPAKFGAAMMVGDEPMDLSADKTVEITAKSTSAKSATMMYLQISDGKTTFLSKTPQPVSAKAATLSFDLTAAAMERVDGPPADFATVVAGVAQIGFKVTSDGSSYSEDVIFDDLAVTN